VRVLLGGVNKQLSLTVASRCVTVQCALNEMASWCLRMLLGFKCYRFISNDEVRRQTNQPLLTEIIQARRQGQTYRPNGRQCRRKADLDFLAFCVLEETTRTTADDLDEDGAERP